MRDGSPKTIYRKEYTAPAFTIADVDLTFAIHHGYTLVSSRLNLQRQRQDEAPWILDGEDLEIECIEIDGTPLQKHEYSYDGSQLTLPQIGDSCQLFTQVRIFPEANTALEGLYRSRTIYCTQCEAEGFRKITFFLDRPDVLAIFKVTVEADKASCPILLSNGNAVSQEDLSEGRHRSFWHDPWPKPCYLFALVAGYLESVSDTFTTTSGREVALNIFVEAKDVNYCDHAMDSLKRSMQWDEEVYGL